MSEARIWSYARALGRAMIHIAPKDFCMQWSGSGREQTISVNCTISTTQEAEAVCEIIMTIARRSLSSHREAVKGDIYPDEPKPSFREELEKMFGPCVTLAPCDSGRHPQDEKPQALSPEGVPERPPEEEASPK